MCVTMETCPCSSIYFFETIVTGGILIQMSSSLNPVAFYTAFRPVAYFRHSSSRPHIPFLPACGEGVAFSDANHSQGLFVWPYLETLEWHMWAT